MLPRIKTFALVVSCLYACTSETSHAGSRIDSASIARGDSTALAARSTSEANPPPPTAVSRPHPDTAIPRTFLVTTPWVDTKEAIDTSLSAPNFQCAPRSFTTGDTLTLRIEVPHGAWLSVKRPDETTFYLVSPVGGSEPNYSVVPSEGFSAMLLIRFRADITSRPLLYGHDNVEPIFTQPGKYVFLVGNNLASDHAGDVRECTIRLVPVRN
jgi:hypothetical protein